MIYYLRNSFNKLENTFSDVKSYFVDLEIEFVYEMFRKIYTFMIVGYNFTSEAFLNSLNGMN